jgi:hypothetical protein
MSKRHAHVQPRTLSVEARILVFLTAYSILNSSYTEFHRAELGCG